MWLQQPFIILMQKLKDYAIFSYRLTYILAVTVAIFYFKSQRILSTNLYIQVRHHVAET